MDMLGLMLHVISYTACLCRLLFEGGLDGGRREERRNGVRKREGKKRKGKGRDRREREEKEEE